MADQRDDYVMEGENFRAASERGRLCVYHFFSETRSPANSKGFELGIGYGLAFKTGTDRAPVKMFIRCIIRSARCTLNERESPPWRLCDTV